MTVPVVKSVTVGAFSLSSLLLSPPPLFSFFFLCNKAFAASSPTKYSAPVSKFFSVNFVGSRNSASIPLGVPPPLTLSSISEFKISLFGFVGSVCTLGAFQSSGSNEFSSAHDWPIALNCRSKTSAKCLSDPENCDRESLGS